MENTKKLLTTKELAERRHMTEGALANWRVKGKGPKFQAGRPVLYSLEEVLKWEASLTVSSTSQDHSK